jgi:YVTN family beta-propeller protein
MVASSDGTTLYLACATASCIVQFDVASQKVSGFVTVPKEPLGVAVSTDQKQLFVTCAAPESRICVVDRATLTIIRTIPVGHTAMAPVVSPDGQMLFVCNRFNNDVSVVNLAAKKEVCRIAVEREPVAAAITRDGKFLLVANHLPVGRADTNYVAAAISVIDTLSNNVVKELQLPNGSGSLNDIRLSPDGKYAVVTHLVSRFNRLPTHANEGWINANALTIIDIAGLRIRDTVILDDHYHGAANPWGIAWSSDSASVVVTHAGTHEVSVIDFSKLLSQIPSLPEHYDPIKAADLFAATKKNFELPDELPFIGGCRIRLKLPVSDLGPRSIVSVGSTFYVANYFSDTLTVIELTNAVCMKTESIALGPKAVPMNAIRKGEFYFNDGGICYDGWQSCASCHPGDGRMDGLNWDLLNDGVGNPKKTKSLLKATKIHPLMSLGVRADAAAAVREGVEHMLFMSQPKDEIVSSIVAYLDSLEEIPSPFLVHGKLSLAAKRGKRIFKQAGCEDCHGSRLYTDQLPHDVGTRASFDNPVDKFYTPALIEVWRNAPYLHDGSAATIRDVVVGHNPNNEHGAISKFSARQIDDLCAYVLSL